MRALAYVRIVAVAVQHWQLDILCGGRARQQVKLLEHEANGFIAHPGALFGRQLIDGLALEFVTAGVGTIQQTNDIYQRCLAGP